jgi:hypothetical protein
MTRLFRLRDELSRQVGRRRADWQSVQLILGKPTPANERNPSTWSKSAPNVHERSDGVSEEHYAETRKGSVETARREGVDFRIAFQETHVPRAARFRAHHVQCGREHVNANDLAIRPHKLG